MVLVSKEYAWGRTWREKNRFQEYFVAVVLAVKDEDWMYVKQLTDELNDAQKWDLWWRLASNTRKAIKDNDCIDIQPP